MKNFTHRLLAVLAFALTMAGASLHAQICIPDPSFTAPGIYPDTLLPACVGTSYSQVITFIVPFDTTVTVPPFGTFNLPIDSVKLDDVLNLPAGMSYACTPVNCSFAGSSINCIVFSGVPTVPGVYDIRVAVTAYVTFFGPIAASDTISLYNFVVGAGVTDTLEAVVDDCGIGVGSATVSTGGDGPFSYLWSDGQTTATASGLTAGAYSLILTDRNGCKDTLSAVVGNDGAPALELDSTDEVSCYGFADGMAEVTATGGTGALSYAWNTIPPQTDRIATGLSTGAYTVVATDGKGCTATLEVLVGGPDSLALTLDATHETLAGAADGTVTVTAIGGTGSLTYAWSNGETGASIDSLAPGTYTVEAMDENGCITVDSVVIEVGPVSIDGRLEAGFASVRLFPNPAQDVLTLHIVLEDRDDLTIRLADVTGRVLRVHNLVQTDRYEATWDMSHYAAGSYLLSIHSAQGARVHRRVVLR